MRRHHNLQELYDLQNKNEVFEFICQNNEQLWWQDILHDMQLYCEKNYHQTISFPKYFHTKKEFKILENLGIDYNFKDHGGRNFLHHVCSTLGSTSEELRFTKYYRDYLLDGRINNIYENTNANKNILFDLVDISIGGYDAENFIKIVNKFPHFDLNQKDQHGRNLLNYAVSKGNINLAHFLIDKNLSVDHKDEKGQTLLADFLFLGHHENQEKLFMSLIKKIDITAKSKREKETILDIWFSWTLSDNLNLSTKQLSHDWIQSVCQAITNDEIYKTKNTTSNLMKIFTKNAKAYETFMMDFNLDQAMYKSALVTLYKEKLEKSFPVVHSENKSVKKI